MTTSNVTIDPSHKAMAARQLEIEQVRSCKSGRLIDVRQFIERQSYAGFVRCRGLVKEFLYRGKPRFVCSECVMPVYLVASPEMSFYFRHTIEDGSCPALTRSPYSREQIKAMKYLGARESEAHKRMKGRLVRSLEVDANVADIKVEETWRSKKNPSAYKRPDVQARYCDIRIALEVQLSTTFLDVVVGRREFYRDDKAMLLWVLQRFNPDYRRMTEDDILFNNNANVLVVDDETVRLSEERRSFHVRCYYWEPYLDGERLQHKWSERVCGLNELTLDVLGQRAFFFDVTACRIELRRQQVEQRVALRQAAEDDIRKRFYAFCDSWTACEDPDEIGEEWGELIDACAELNVRMPERPDKDGKFRSLALALASIKCGRPVGFKFKKLIEVLHTIAERHKDLLWYVGWAVRVYDQAALIESEDRFGKWASRQKQIRAAMHANHEDYRRYTQWGSTLAFLFPEMAQQFDAKPSTGLKYGGDTDLEASQVMSLVTPRESELPSVAELRDA